MPIAIALIVLTLGSLLFHYLSPWYLTPIASNWGDIDDTIGITFWVTGAAFVLVNLFMAYCVIKFRKREGSRAAYEPESPKLEAWLIAITTLGVVAMLAPGLFAWGKVIQVPKDAAVVEVLGRQWNWSYRFPGPDGEFGKSDPRLVNDDNPYGLVPDDPKGADDVLVANPELHLPLGKPVKVVLRSLDVLHNFTVPQFRVKMDLVPGMVTFFWVTPTREGRFDVLCEELCGLAHFAMRGKVTVEPEAAFQAWLGTHPTFARSRAATRTAADPAAGQALYATCAACHGAGGEGNAALNAPKLAGQAGWYLERQLATFRSGARGTDERDTYGKQMAPMALTLPDDKAVANVISYIRTLPDHPPAPTLTMGPQGKHLYEANCAACHGMAGEGIKAANAPRLAGMSDWYMVTQIKNFQQGIRGTHPKDVFGPQMVAMAAVFRDEAQIKDIVAHIMSLKGAPEHAAARPGTPEAHAKRTH